MSRSVDRVLIQALHAQGFVQPKGAAKLGKETDRDPLMEQSHIKDFAMVETLDSHEKNLHEMRQLTGRENFKRQDDNQTDKKNQLESTSADNILVSGSSVASKGQTDRVGEPDKLEEADLKIFSSASMR